jgi:hypothetical protein
MFRNALLSAALLTAGLAGAASAAEPFRVMSQGENFSVDYSNNFNNIVGGGYAKATGGGQDVRITYADPTIGNKAPGIPVFTGGSQGGVAYIVTSGATAHASR